MKAKHLSITHTQQPFYGLLSGSTRVHRYQKKHLPTHHPDHPYRPTDSTTASIITILHAVTHLLATNPYVIVIALDFSKAFDTVRHHTLLEKIAKLDIPDLIYNWLTDFFTGHSHQTHYGGSVSQIQCISASIIQGLAVGPTSYVANASDLHTIYHGSELCKYADDTCLIVPASNVDM